MIIVRFKLILRVVSSCSSTSINGVRLIQWRSQVVWLDKASVRITSLEHWQQSDGFMFGRPLMIQKHTILYFNFFFCERKDEYQSDEFQLHGSFYCNLTKELSKCLIEPLKCSQQEFTHGFTRLICSNTLPSRIWFSKIENLIK